MKLTIRSVKTLSWLASLLVILMFFEYIAFGTVFSFVVFLIVCIPIFTIRCQNCKTHLLNHKIASSNKGFRWQDLQNCPVCGEPMLQA
jgi:Zn finger protein HypA/HybF involved in hydrogenase expression